MPSRTQIVATIGPATKEPAVLDQLVAHGMDVGRLNFSHGTYEEHEYYIREIRAAGQRGGRTIPIIQDLSGPRVKTETGHGMATDAVKVITEKDLRDLDFGLKQNVEYVCLSYVGSAGDVEELRAEITKRGGSAKVMAKVERAEALENIHGIIKASDAIMLGRGDLGQSIPIERVPFAEIDVVRLSKAAGKPVIVATEMLKTMVENEVPTRAEVTDVAFAVMLGADAVMLSEETARGKYPVQAVTVMEKIVLEAERYEREVNPL